eukprot:m.302777 g.302777  ORF g.302777 m.302777 type:complete len:59 (+) comp40827_c0_seq3:3330-3506(+)
MTESTSKKIKLVELFGKLTILNPSGAASLDCKRSIWHFKNIANKIYYLSVVVPDCLVV